MPFFELPNGKTIYLTVEDLLNLDDDRIQELIANDSGEFVENPFVNYPNINLNVDKDIEEFLNKDYNDLKFEDIYKIKNNDDPTKKENM
jgi:hypothetical protein